MHIIIKIQIGTQVYSVKLKSATRLKPSNMLGTSSDPLFEFKVRPADKKAGEQLQRSTYKPSTLDPIWEPPEKFQFIVSTPKNARIIISGYT